MYGIVILSIQSWCCQAPVALPMVLLVKRWAKIEGLNKAYEKTLTLGHGRHGFGGPFFQVENGARIDPECSRNMEFMITLGT